MQTSWIAGSLFVGFVVFITVKGELTAYKAAIFGKGPDPQKVVNAAADMATSQSEINQSFAPPK